jgi:hypothetical protein
MNEDAEYYIDTQMNYADPETEHGYQDDPEDDDAEQAEAFRAQHRYEMFT